MAAWRVLRIQLRNGDFDNAWGSPLWKCVAKLLWKPFE
jgi:hypothetical protein